MSVTYHLQQPPCDIEEKLIEQTKGQRRWEGGGPKG